MVRKHRHLCVKTLIFNFQFTSNHSRWTVQHAGSTFWAPQLWSSCSWYRFHILGAENHINQQRHCRYLNPFKPNSTQNPGDSTCSNGEALVPVSVSMTSVRKQKQWQASDKCADGDVSTICTTKRKPFSTITLNYGEPVKIARVMLFNSCLLVLSR